MNAAKDERITVHLGEIVKVHQAVAELREPLSLPTLPMHPCHHLPVGALDSLLATFPIPVKRFSKGLACVGNVRLFEVCCACLPSDHPVAVKIIRKKLSGEEIKVQYLTEITYSHIIHNLDRRDIRILYGLLQGERTRISAEPIFNSRHAFSEALGVAEGWLSK